MESLEPGTETAGAQLTPDLSIIVPAYNDAGSIEAVVREASYVASQAAPRHEILVVNDGSRDSTGEILDKLSREFDALRVIHHKVNRGFGYTMRELYHSAAGKLVFSIPGDGQIRAAQLERMLPAAELADLVVGWREIRNDAGRRKRQSYVYNFLIRTLYGVTIGDVNSVKLIHRRLLDAVVPLQTESPFIDAELCIRALRRGFLIRGVVIEHMPRQYGTGSGGKWGIIWATIKDMLLMWPALRSTREGPWARSHLQRGSAGDLEPPVSGSWKRDGEP
ncbi:MAG: glycosyltransferase family 2 protein [Deltaproteobacteria bacterium]|nr:glycosyltransferase family 2 protein [Deltaproteobacteria bacterium]